MRRVTVAAAALLAVVAFGCLPVQSPENELLRNPSFHIMVKDGATIPASATFDFATKLYKIDETQDVDIALLDRRLTEALEAELGDKNYRRARTEPEILVSYAVAIDATLSAGDLEKAYAEDFPIQFPSRAPEQEMHYHQGVLLVDFVDRGSKRLLWRGAIRAELDRDVTDETKRRRPREAVRVLLQHFPQPVVAKRTEGSVATP